MSQYTGTRCSLDDFLQAVAQKKLLSQSSRFLVLVLVQGLDKGWVQSLCSREIPSLFPLNNFTPPFTVVWLRIDPESVSWPKREVFLSLLPPVICEKLNMFQH